VIKGFKVRGVSFGISGDGPFDSQFQIFQARSMREGDQNKPLSGNFIS
jgi:hypothetical protein